MKTTISVLIFALLSTSAIAGSWTVYQGNPKAGHVLGGCSTRAQCTDIRRANPGRGESVVNNRTGEMVNKPGNSDARCKHGCPGGGHSANHGKKHK